MEKNKLKKFSFFAAIILSSFCLANERMTLCEWLEQTNRKTLVRVERESGRKTYIVRDSKEGERMNPYELTVILEAMLANEINCWEKE